MRQIIVLSVLMAALASCELEVSDNGNLDGFWHLEKVDTLQTGGTSDLSDRLLFWSVQMNLLELSDRSEGNGFLLLRFEQNDGSLHVHTPTRFDGKNTDLPIDDLQQLAPFGIQSLDETFRIIMLSSGRMVLEGDRLRLSFSKM
ncbi:MAG: lipocalin-like domain-containing protein [Prevotella sp.]|nr:lipocalin-like domain-containing protein [Prevotella sp.]